MTAPNCLHPIIRERQSIVAFSQEALPQGALRAILEAARWAPSSRNAQPWRFIVGVNGRGTAHEKLADCLTGRNRVWAPRAPVLILAAAEVRAPGTKKDSAYARHDTGLAVENLLLQAVAEGLAAHPMAGFDKAMARDLFGIPGGYEPMTMIAVGLRGDKDALDPLLRSRDSERSSRRSLYEIAFGDAWGVPLCDPKQDGTEI